MKNNISLIILSIFASYSIAYANESAIINENTKDYKLTEYLFYLEDTKSKLTIKDVTSASFADKFIHNSGRTLNFGYTMSTYWIKFSVTYAPQKNKAVQTWLLEIDYPLLDYLSLYIPKEDGIYRQYATGDNIPFNKRLMRHQNFVFPVTLAPNQKTTMYLRVKTEGSLEIPLTIWSPLSFAEEVNDTQYILGIYYGVMIIMMVYNLFIFFFFRDKSYLFYVFFILSYILLQMTLSGQAYEYFWPNSPHWTNRSLTFLIGSTTIWVCLFTKYFLRTKNNIPIADKFLKISIALIIVFIIISFFINYHISIQISMLYVIILVIFVIGIGIISLYRGLRTARFFLIAWTSFLAGTVIFILKSFGVLPSIFFTTYAIQIGSAMVVVLLSLALGDRINIINQQKKQAQNDTIDSLMREDKQKDRFLHEMNEVNKKISVSEERYRVLVEGSNEIIFSLDENFCFITVNRRFKTYFKASPDLILKQNILDIIYEDMDGEDITKKLVKEKLEKFSNDRKPIQFKAKFKSPIINEPKEMQVRLQYINIEGKNEILGKASSIAEDALLKYFISEKQIFNIENYLITAEEISYRITRNLTRHIDQKTVDLLRIGLREIIINAIEHGNLDISFEDKTREMMNDNYFNYIAEQRKKQRDIDRKVHIDYCMDSKKVQYIITDEGMGFDHQKILKNQNTIDELMLEHGRGILMAKNIFDEIIFNDKGNQVTLIKYCR